MEEKLRGKDFTFIIICLAVIAIGLIIGLNYFKKAFPEASIDFKVTRAGSKPIAQDFLDKRGFDLKGYINAGAFEYDDYAKVFLEKELGLAKAQEYFGHPVKLWYWEQRWFKPEQKEEFSAKVTPEGEVIGFTHEIPEEQAGDSLSSDSVRVLAEDFLKNVMGKDIADLEYVMETRYSRPHRVDYFLTYKVKNFEPAPDSDYRLGITIQGSQVDGYREYLRVPEKWKQSYQELRSYNNTASLIASLLLVLTIVAMVTVIFFRIRKRDVRWKTAMWFGIVGFALVFLNQLNSLPLTMLGYDTTDSYSGFLIRTIGMDLLQAFLMGGILIAVLTAAAETMYRERYGRFTSISRLFSWQSWRSKSFFKGVLLGLTLAAFFFAYQIVFYLVADKFGAWAPADVPYSNLLNTAFPWVAVLMIGFFPAVSEEFISRAFSIPFLQKFLKSGFLAIVIPAFIWGFGHSGYANQPFFIRGLEVGFGGIIIGLVMLRWGILPTLVWHYTVDALYTAFLLFRSGNWYFIVTAGVATGLLLIPLLIALISYLTTGKFKSPLGIRNQDDVSTPAEIPISTEAEGLGEKPEEISYVPLKSGTKAKGVILGLVCLLVTLIPYQKLGKNAPDFQVTASRAELIANEFLVERGVDVRGMKSAVGIKEILNDNSGKYFLTHGGIADFNRLTGNTYPPNVWDVRRFIPGNRDEWHVNINPETGEMFSFLHMLPEETSGDSLSKDSAMVLAESALTKNGIDLDRYTLKLSQANKRPNRMDYNFVYEANEGDRLNLQEAKYRVTATIAGSLVAGVDRYYWIPEAWTRQQESTTALKAIFKVVRIVAIALFFGLALFYLIKLSRQGSIPWKRAAVIAIFPTAILALNGFNFFPNMLYREYNVVVPIKMYDIQMLVGYLLQLLFYYILWLLVSALLMGCYPKTIAEFGGSYRRRSGYDTLIGIFLALCFSVLFVMIVSVLESVFPTWIPFSGITSTSALAGPVPFLDQMTGAVGHLLRYILIIGFGIYLWKNVLKSIWLKIAAVILILFALTPGAATELGEIILSWIDGLILLLMVLFITASFLRDNIVAYFAAVVAVVFFRAGFALFDAGAAIYATQGIIVFILEFIVLLWLIVGSGRRSAGAGI
jgi:membrane protease YdiL (CAAX protease family)